MRKVLTIMEQELYSRLSSAIRSHITEAYGQDQLFSFDYEDLNSLCISGTFTRYFDGRSSIAAYKYFYQEAPARLHVS